MPNATPNSQTLPVLKIQRFSTHDGPGIRTTVFLKGCPLHCVWCHNPESQSLKAQFFFQDSLCSQCGKCVAVCKRNAHYFEDGLHKINRGKCGTCLECVNVCPTQALEQTSRDLNIHDILSIVEKDRVFYENLGGLTLSGGEPLLHGNATITLLEQAKALNIHTVVETCGYFKKELIPKLAKNVDVFLFDLKDTISIRHKENTGIAMDEILENLFTMDAMGGKTILRCILLKGINDNEEHFENLKNIYKKLKNCSHIELFSYHHYGEGKYTALGKQYHGKKEWVVDNKQLKSVASYFKKHQIPCKINV